MASNSNQNSSPKIHETEAASDAVADSSETISSRFQTFILDDPIPCLKQACFFIEPETKVPITLLDEEERIRVADMLEAGFQDLLSSANIKYNPFEYTLLALQVTMGMGIGHEQIREELKESAVATLHDAQPPAYDLKIEDAVGVLQDYAAYWNHSYSLVLGELSDLRNRILSSNLRCKRKVKDDNQSGSCYTEVMLYVLAVDGIDDKGISDRKELKEFLNKLTQKSILKVHATCSKFTREEEEKEPYSHLAIRDLDG